MIVDRARFREGLYGIITELISTTSAKVRTRNGVDIQKIACLIPITMQVEKTTDDTASQLAPAEKL